jgi:hypothetical protein
MYDSSLDAHLPHDWARGFDVFRRDSSSLFASFDNTAKSLEYIQGNWAYLLKDVPLTYRWLPAGLGGNRGAHNYFGPRDPLDPYAPVAQPFHPGGNFGFGGGIVGGFAAFGGAAQQLGNAQNQGVGGGNLGQFGHQIPRPSVNLNNVSARKNLNETAFFLPHVTSGEDGTVRVQFTMTYRANGVGLWAD